MLSAKARRRADQSNIRGGTSDHFYLITNYYNPKFKNPLGIECFLFYALVHRIIHVTEDLRRSLV